MSTTLLIATALIVGSMPSTTFTEDVHADLSQANAIERLQRFGGKVDPYDSPAKQPSWSQRDKPLSSAEPRAVTFFNTNLNDLDLALVTEA